MSADACPFCSAAQPSSSVPSDACTSCGRPLRAELRCGWCCEWVPSGAFCRKCGCKLIPREDFAVARTLKRLGVDMLSLPDRVASLEQGQREHFAAQFASQLGVVARRVDEVRLCEKYLLSKGHAARYEDLAIARLPLPKDALEWYEGGLTGELRDEPGVLEQLVEKLEHHHPIPELAAIALVRQGKVTRDILRTVFISVRLDEFGFDAAYALASWRARPHVFLDRWQLTPTLERAKKAFEDPALRPYAAVVLARFTHADPKPELAAALKDGLASGDDELRFECALALVDEPLLTAALDSGDELKAQAARKALARAGHGAVASLVAEGSAAARKDVLQSLRTVEKREVATALMGMAENGTDGERARVVNLLTIQVFENAPEEVRDAITSWADAGAPGLNAEQKLRIFNWGVNPSEYGLTVRSGRHLRGYVTLAQQAVDAADDEKAALVQDGNFARLIVLWEPPDLPFFRRLALDPRCRQAFFERLFYVHQGTEDSRALELFFALWDSVEDREALVAPVSSAFSSGLARRELFFEALWPRLLRSEQRSLLLRAFAGWRSELWYQVPQKVPDVLERLRLFMSAPGSESYREISASADKVPPEQAEAFFDLVFDFAMSVVSTRPRTAVASAFNAISVITNAYRSDPRPERDGLVDRMEQRTAELERAFKEAKPSEDSEDRAANLLEDFHTSIRMCREVKDRREEAKRRDEERARRAEEQRLRAEQVQREAAEAATRAQQAQAQAAEMAAKVREAVAAMAPKPSVGGALQPQVPLLPIDSEPLLPGTPLPTLVDYVRFMKEMGAGGDIMKLMESRGLSIQTWPVIAGGWSSILSTKMEAGLRFGALMAAPWA